MAFRVTRQNVEVLGPGDGAVRVTRQNVEVLGPGDGAVRVTRQNVEVLGPGDCGVLRVTRQNVNVLGSESSDIRVTRQFIEVLREAPFFSYLVDLIPLEHSVIVSGIRSYSAEDDMLDTGIQWDIDGTSSLYLGLRDEVELEIIKLPNETHYLPITDSVGLVKILTTATEFTVEDTIVFDESVGLTTDELVIVDAVTLEICTPIYDAIVLVDEVALELIAVPSPVDTLALEQSVSYSILQADTYCTYSPFVGTTSDADAPTPPATTIAAIIKYDDVELTYPTIAPTSTLTLRGPEFGNRDNIRFQRISRETRGGTLVVFADPIWPDIQTMIIEFYGLSEVEAQEVLTFISDSLGKQIGIRDWEGRRWVGIITSPQNPISREGKGCTKRISLELNVESLLANLDAEDTIAFVATATLPALAWKTFTDAEWDTFAGFAWDIFLEE